MSTLQFLRERAGILVAGVIGLSLFIFVISDFFGNGSAQRGQAKKYYEIGRINGEYISYQDFQQRVENLVEVYKLSGTTNIDEAMSESIRENVWQQITREKILDSDHTSLGIGVSTEELDELVLGDNPHPIVQQLFTDPNSGMFNKSFLVNFLKQIDLDEQAKNYWLFFEDEIVNDRKGTKYNTLVSKGIYATGKQAEFDMELNKATVDFSYVVKSYASVPDSLVKINESEIKDYYKGHKENFKRTPLRDIEYVTFDVVPSEEDIKLTEEKTAATIAEFKAATNLAEFINLSSDTRHDGFYYTLNEIPETLKEFVQKEDKNEVFGPYRDGESFKLVRLIDFAERPDSVHARHILLTPNATMTVEQTRLLADSLIGMIKTGVPFEVLALTNSTDQGSAQIGGDLGWFPEGRMVVPFNNACFAANKGEIVKVETQYGLHIIEVTEQSKKSRKYDIGIIDRKIIASSATNQNIYSAASAFAGNNNTYEKFNSAIVSMNLSKSIANDVTPEQKTLPGLESPRSLVISLFSAEEGAIVLDNTEQAVFEIDNKYVVAYCTKAQEEGIADLKNVESDIRFILLRDKKADIISAQFLENKKSSTTIDDLAGKMLLNVQDASQINFRSYSVPGVAGTEPSLISAASASSQGVLAGPVKGTNGVYMLYVNGISSTDNQDLALLKERLAATYQMRGSYEAYEALRKAANVVDKRYKFY